MFDDDCDLWINLDFFLLLVYRGCWSEQKLVDKNWTNNWPMQVKQVLLVRREKVR